MGLAGLIEHHAYIATAAATFLACVECPFRYRYSCSSLAQPRTGGHLDLLQLLPPVWLAAVAGDTLLYVGGRFTGRWLLAMLCRLTTNPEQCIFRSADYFYRHGPHTLLFSKFVPGLGAMAAPLAGSLNMRLGRFLRLDAAGAIFYTSTWIFTGYLFSRFIRLIEFWIAQASHVVMLVILVLVSIYAVSWFVFYLRARRFASIERVPAADLHQRLQTEDPNRLVIIADVRSHGYYDPGMQRIKKFNTG